MTFYLAMTLQGAQRSLQESGGISAAQQSTLDKHQFCLLVYTLQELTPMLFACVLTSAPFAQKVDSVEDISPITRECKLLLWHVTILSEFNDV